jgi:hypothetical protein
MPGIVTSLTRPRMQGNQLQALWLGLPAAVHECGTGPGQKPQPPVAAAGLWGSPAATVAPESALRRLLVRSRLPLSPYAAGVIETCGVDVNASAGRAIGRHLLCGTVCDVAVECERLLEADEVSQRRRSARN